MAFVILIKCKSLPENNFTRTDFVNSYFYMGYNELHNGVGSKQPHRNWRDLRISHLNGHNVHNSRPKMEIKGLIILLKISGIFGSGWILGYTLLHISFNTWEGMLLGSISCAAGLVYLAIGAVKLLKAWDDYLYSRWEHRKKRSGP
jgi:hypothetical protein